MLLSFPARTAIAVVALLLVGLLAGCGEEDPSSTPPPSGPSQSEVSSPGEPTETATQPVDRSTPIETVRNWVAAHNDALGSGDTEGAEALTKPGCRTCRELRNSVKDVYESGGYFRGGRWTIDAAKVTNRAPNSSTVTAGITIAAGVSKSAEDADPSEYAEQKHVLEFRIRQSGSQFLITQLVFLS